MWMTKRMIYFDDMFTTPVESFDKNYKTKRNETDQQFERLLNEHIPTKQSKPQDSFFMYLVTVECLRCTVHKIHLLLLFMFGL